MAGSIPPPLVSSSPPPLTAFDDDDDDDDEDDEFGIFNAAEDIEFNEVVSYKEKDIQHQSNNQAGGEQDSTSQDSATDSGLCPDSEGVSPSPHSDDEKIVKPRLCGDGLFNNSDESPSLTLCSNSDCIQDKLESAAAGTFYPQNSCLDCEKHLSSTEYGFENVKTPLSSLEPTSNNESETNSEDIRSNELSDHSKDKQSVYLYEIDEENPDQLNKQKENDVLSATGFNVASVNQSTSESEDSKTENARKEDYFSTMESALGIDAHNLDKETSSELKEENDEFDDFRDFQATFPNPTDDSCALNQNCEYKETLQTLPPDLNTPEEAAESFILSQDESDDEFSNFADFSSSDCVFVSAPSSNTLENSVQAAPSDTELRTKSVFQDWASVFPVFPSEPLTPSEGALVGDRDAVWSRLLPLDVTPALSHQWSNSLAYRRLLSSLNIDSRNILLMPWSNSGVPRFAATLSGGPLEPVKAMEPLQPAPAPPTIAPASPNSQNPEIVPDAHFDWVSSGLTNPLDCTRPVLNVHKTLSVEAEKILSSLPDLSFMRRPYIDFPISDG